MKPRTGSETTRTAPLQIQLLETMKAAVRTLLLVVHLGVDVGEREPGWEGERYIASRRWVRAFLGSGERRGVANRTAYVVRRHG